MKSETTETWNGKIINLFDHPELMETSKGSAPIENLFDRKVQSDDSPGIDKDKLENPV